MKKITKLFLTATILLCSSFYAFALESSLLWKISGNGLSKPSYLFAAMSPICAPDYLWTITMQNCFLKSEQLCTDLPYDEPDTVTNLKMFYTMKATSKVPLEHYLAPDQYKEVNSYFQEKYGSPVVDLKPMWLVMLMAKGNYYTCDSLAYYEYRLVDSARKYQKALTSFEWATHQLLYIDELIPDTVAVPDLMDIVRKKKTKDTVDFSEATMVYKTQNIDSIYARNLRDTRSDHWGKIDKVRINAWTKRIQQLAQENSTFFVVRPYMLSGKMGLIYLLRQAGYTVTPLR